jgi:cobalt-zinc-cadmium efflux system protein
VHSVAEIRHVGPVNGVLLAILGGGALMVNVATALVTHEHHGADLNVRAVTLHLAGDGLASAAVAVAGIVIAETGRFMILDPAVALAIALLIALQGWRVAKEGIEILLEATPVDVDLVALVRTISAVTGVEEVHDLHCWSISSEVRALSAHLVLAGHPSLEQAQSLGEQVKQVICAGYAIQHTTLELECERCLDGTDDPCGIAELPAPPRRGGQPDPVPLGSRRGGNDAPTR